MTDKELIKQDKEPKCIYNRTLEERKKFCKYCSAACSVRIEEEPASEDLEEEIQRAYYDKSLYDADNLDRQDFNNIARHFAEWQKHQMKETLQTEYEKGRFDMREEIMKDAIECVVEDWCGDSPEITIPLNPQDFKTGDKVKIIVIKSEQ